MPALARTNSGVTDNLFTDTISEVRSRIRKKYKDLQRLIIGLYSLNETQLPMQASGVQRLSVNVPTTLLAETKLLAHLDDETLSSVVIKLLREYVNNRQLGNNR